MPRDKIKVFITSTGPTSIKLGTVGTQGEGLQPTTYDAWSRDHMMSHYKIEFDVPSPLPQDLVPTVFAEKRLGVTISHPLLAQSCEVTWQITNIASPLPQNLRPPIFRLSRFRVRSGRLRSCIITWLKDQVANKKISDKDSIFFLQDSRNYQIWLCGDLKWNVMWQNKAKYAAKI